MARTKSPGGPGNALDVAIVAGGISGIYAAYRLTALTDKSVTVFEGSDHIGGRLLSVTPPGLPNMRAELGGMRILPGSLQPLVNGLIAELGQLGKPVGLYPFPVNGTADTNNIVYVRGERYRWNDIAAGKLCAYRLPDTEKIPLADILQKAIATQFPDIANAGPPPAQRAAAQKATYNGIALYDWGFWDLMTNLISFEAYHLEQDAGGYITTIANWNAANAIPWFLADFGPGATYRGFSDGYRSVVVAMAELLTAAGGSIVTGARLTDFEWKGEQYVLNFAVGEPVYAKALVLAMPRRSLDLIAPRCPDLDTVDMREVLSGVTPYPAYKIFTTYAAPWWREDPLNLSQGRTVTDLPLRQTYYWTDKNGKPIASGKAMLMSSYDDGANPDFWNGFRNFTNMKWHRGGKRAAAEALAKGASEWADDPPQWPDYQGTERLGAEVQKQLAIVHGVDPESVQSIDIACQDWGADPYGGGWNFWNVGVQSPKVMERLAQPIQGRPLYICGEAYSNWQGWVEGALETADMALEKMEVGPRPVITTTQLPGGFLHYPYNAQILAEAGGVSSGIAFRVVAGALPENLTMNSSGAISGFGRNPGGKTFSVVASLNGVDSVPAELAIGFIVGPDSGD